jgi:hypothetical protein
MPQYDVEGTMVLHERLPAANAREAVRNFLLRNNVPPSKVGSRSVIGFDEGNRTPILEGDEYETGGSDDDGVLYFLTKPVNGLGEDDLEEDAPPENPEL